MKKIFLTLFAILLLCSPAQGFFFNSGTGAGGGGGVTTFINLTDTPAAYTGAGGYFVKVNAGATALEFTASTAPAQPAILDSSQHTDTLTGTVVRGDLIIGNSTPKWARLAKGTSGSVLTSGASDVAWTGYYLSGTSGKTYTFPSDTATLVPAASPTFTGTVTLPAAPFTVGTTAVTTTGTQFNYLKDATGTTGTATKNLVFSESPTLTGTVVIPTPFTLGATSVTATGTQINYLASATGTTGTATTNVVFSTSPTLVTPALGAATATSINKVAITAPATASTLTIAEGLTLSVGTGSVTLTGNAAGSTLVLPSGSTTLAAMATAAGSWAAPGAAIGTTTAVAGTFTTLVAGATASMTLGTAGTAVGQILLKNATSGTLTVEPITGALSATLVLGNTFTNAKWCSYATATGFTCNETAPQAALTYPVTGVASPTAGYLTKWGESGNAIVDGPKLGTLTDTKWCSYSTAGGLACTEAAPTGGGTITAVGDIITAEAFTEGTPGKTLVWDNATSGTITLQAVAGALGTTVLSLPATTGTLAKTSDLIGGTWAAPGAALGTGTPVAGTFTTLTANAASSLTLGTASSAAGAIILHNATNANHFTITSGVSGAALAWTLPTAVSGGDNYLLNADADGTMGYTDPATFSPAAGSASIETVGTVSSGVWSGTAVAANKGGTGQTVYTIGDILYASSTSALSKLAAPAAGQVVVSAGTGTAPAWSANPALSYISLGSGPSGSGAIRLSNGDSINWEASPAGGDVTGISVDSDERIQIGTTNATGVTITPATLISGVVSAGTGPTTLTDAAGKILAAALNTVGAAQGGTGVANNAASTITITGAYGITFTVGATTALTLPASGTVAVTGHTHVDADISDTLTASVLKGSGSDTDAVDLATAEVAGTLTVNKGGTGKASWTLYALPYASGTTTIAEVPVGTAGQYLKVNSGADGYDWGTPSGVGDVTGVGDCASGACLDGSSDGGTYISLYSSTAAVRLRNNAGVMEVRNAADSAYANLVVAQLSTEAEDGSNKIGLANNTVAVAPTASSFEIYPDVGIWKFNQNGTEYTLPLGPTAGQIIFSGPTAARTFALPDQNATILTNVTAVTVGQGGTGLTSGTSGGVPYFSATNAITSSTALTQYNIVLGGGAGAAPVALGSMGTSAQVLHGNAIGAPSFSAVSLTADVTGTLPVANGGTSLSSGTEGGIPWYTTTTAMASSALLAQYQVIVGGGVDAAPATLGATGAAGNPLISGGSAANPSWLAVVLAGGTNTFNIANGTASLDVAAGAAVDINFGLTVNTAAVTLVGKSGGSSLTLPTALSLDGTMTNTYLCKYTTAGTILSCDVNPATFSVAAGSSSIVTVGALSAGSLASGFTPVTVPLGGTGASTYALNGVLYGNAASAIGVTAIGAAGQILRVGADPFVPAWSTSIFADTYAQGGILHAATANTIAALAPGAVGSFLMSNGTGAALSYLAAGAANYVLVGAGTTTIPVWTASTGTGAPVLGTAPQISTIELGHASDTTLARSAAGVVTVENLVLPRIIASGATALDFASTATGACATVIQAAATNVATTDVIIFNPNASIKAVTGYVPASTGGMSVTAFPTAGYVNWEACNWTADTVDPGSITVNWMVIR